MGKRPRLARAGAFFVERGALAAPSRLGASGESGRPPGAVRTCFEAQELQ